MSCQTAMRSGPADFCRVFPGSPVYFYFTFSSCHRPSWPCHRQTLMYLRFIFWISQPLFHNETFIFNFAALTTPWGHIVCRGLYHLLASKSADLLPQLLLTINRKSKIQSQIILSSDFFTTYWHPSLQIFCHNYFWPSTENPKSNPKSYCHQIF